MAVIKEAVVTKNPSLTEVLEPYKSMCGQWRVISYNENVSRVPPGVLISQEYTQSYKTACRLKRRSPAVAEEGDDIYIDIYVQDREISWVFGKDWNGRLMETCYHGDDITLFEVTNPSETIVSIPPPGAEYDFHVQYPGVKFCVSYNNGSDSMRMEFVDESENLSIVYTIREQSDSSPDYQVETSIEIILSKISSTTTILSDLENKKKRRQPRCRGCFHLRKGHIGPVGIACKNAKAEVDE